MSTLAWILASTFLMSLIAWIGVLVLALGERALWETSRSSCWEGGRGPGPWRPTSCPPSRSSSGASWRGDWDRASTSFSCFPFAAGNFVYIAASDLIPEIKHAGDARERFGHFVAFLLGILLLLAVRLAF